jgi:transcriptional repressor NrdR
VSEQDLALLAQQVEETLRASGVSIVSSEEVGKAILPYLSDLDQIAYLRFASVYRGFKTLDDFEAAIAELRGRRDAPDPAPVQNPVPAGDSKAPGARQARRRPRRTAAAPEEPTLLDG